MRNILLPFCLCCGAIAFAQDKGSTVGADASQVPPPRTLRATSEIPLNVPNLGFSGEPVCDASGDMFFEIHNAQPGLSETGPFLGIQSNGSTHALFSVPAELTAASKTPGITLQAVSPGGDYYLLNTDFKRYTLIAYNADGSEKRREDLEVPPDISPHRLAVTDSGVSYVQGYLDTNDPLDKPRKAFAALFSSSGKMVKSVGSGWHDISIVTMAKFPLEGAVTAGDDGRFYILEAGDVLVLNQSGEVQQKLIFHKPDPSAIALRIDVSSGVVAIELGRITREPKKAPTVSLRFLVLDSQTGEQRGDYVFDPEQYFNAILCFTRSDGYTVYAIKGGQAAKQTLPLR
jgi:hypothetical protein